MFTILTALFLLLDLILVIYAMIDDWVQEEK